MNLCYSFFLVLICTNVSHSSIVQLHVVFRHGERAPTETYKNDPYINMTWSGGWGQLTNRGKFQMYKLGEKLRRIYSNFVSEYYFHEDVSVLSSYADRCLMSAEVLLAGLFPPKDKQIWKEQLLWQPIPVHYIPRSKDNLIAMKAKCKNYDQELETILKSGAIQKINEDNAKLYEYLTKYSGQKIDSIGSVELLYNTLEIELLHNLTLPVWTKNISLEHMKALAARSLESFTETDFMKRMKGGVFFKKLISLMEAPEKGPLLYLYSAHDLTLVNILKTAGYKSILKPGFGASLIFELHNQSEVVVLYRDDTLSKPETIILQHCAPVCYVDQFRKSLDLFLPTDLQTECNQARTYKDL